MKPWLRTLIAYAIPLIILGTSIWVMTLEPTSQQNQQFIQHTNQIEELINHAQWNDALKELRMVDKIYTAALPRIQFSMERDEINDVKLSLTRLKAYLVTGNRAEALASTLEARQHWQNLGR
ncbi:MAG: DUF4363 family protein [Methylocystaceae bacterium]